MVVTDVLGRRQAYLEDFEDRADLIAANMASIHIPIFLDFKPFSFYRSDCCLMREVSCSKPVVLPSKVMCMLFKVADTC